MNPEELQKELTTLKGEFLKLKNDFAAFNVQTNIDKFSAKEVKTKHVDITTESSLSFNSNTVDTSPINFDYDFMGTPATRKTRFRIVQEANGGDLLIQSNLSTTPVTVLRLGENLTFIANDTEINLTATDTYASGHIKAQTSTATAAGGAKAFSMGTDGVGIFWGSGAPSITAVKGSLYLRTDGSTTNDRAYINTNGSTTWTALTTVA